MPRGNNIFLHSPKLTVKLASMTLLQTLELTTESLKKNKITHALIGGFALAAYGVARTTVDIDFLVDGKRKEDTRTALLNAGFQIFYESDEVLQVSGPGQVDVIFANRSLSQKLLAEARAHKGFPLPVVSAEGLIGLKIQAYKNDPKRELQDKADIQALLTQNPNLDLTEIKKYADLFDEWPFVQKLQELINEL